MRGYKDSDKIYKTMKKQLYLSVLKVGKKKRGKQGKLNDAIKKLMKLNKDETSLYKDKMKP